MRTFIACLILMLMGPIFAIDARNQPAPRQNIVVFLSDDHGQLDSTPYGATDVRTPNMQRLADAGMTFTDAFIASPACAPTRSAMLTGLMPARNGAEPNHSYKRDDVASLPEALRKLGYQTAAFGKVSHGNESEFARHGFDVFDRKHDAAFVQKFLEERDAAKPLCLFVGTHEPHVPWPDLEGYDPAKVNGRMNVYPIRSVRTRDWKYLINLNPELAHTTHIDKAKGRDGLKYWVPWFEKAKTDPRAAAIVKRYHERPKEELYDLRNDLFEQHNLAVDPKHARRLAQMRAQLEDWMKAQDDSRKIFNKPWPLSEPASTQPAVNDEPQSNK
jgi:arylsulfatase A-like enzyme